MEKLQTLEELRTKEEVLNYFKQLGKNITEEQIDALKQSYDKVQENNETLTIEQLSHVAGGIAVLHITQDEFGYHFSLSGSNIDRGVIQIYYHNNGYTLAGNLEQFRQGDRPVYEALGEYVLEHQGEENLGLRQSIGPDRFDMNIDPEARDRLISNLNEHFVQGNIARDDFERGWISITDQISRNQRFRQNDRTQVILHGPVVREDIVQNIVRALDLGREERPINPPVLNQNPEATRKILSINRNKSDSTR